MSHLQTYIFSKPNNKVLKTHRRRRRQSEQIAACELGISLSSYSSFEAGRCGLPLDRFEKLGLTPFDERLCLRASCRRGEVSSRTSCPQLDDGLKKSLEISEHIAKKTKRRLNPASPLVKLANRYHSDDDFAERIRRQLLTQPPQHFQSNHEFYDQLVDSLAEHRVHALAHPLNRGWMGYSLSPNQSIIVVNRNLPINDQIYSLIAQLGDLLSNNATSRPISFDKVDQLINSFAAHFIVPLKELRKQITNKQIKLDQFDRHFRGGNSSIIRRQLERLRPEFNQPRQFSRLVGLLTARAQDKQVRNDDSLVRKLIDFNGYVYLTELATVTTNGHNWSVRTLPKGLFGYQPSQLADQQAAAHLLNNLKTKTSRKISASIRSLR